MYIGIETVLALVALPARTILGFQLEPQFNEPYLTTSLQDFWARRWNLMVSSVLRDTAYNPVRRALVSIMGPKWAQFMGLMASFVVSGLMHESIYYYLSRARPTWEVTLFFVLQGVSTGIEIAVKRAVGDTWRLHRVVSGVLTLGFLVLTGNWLFFPQLLRNGVHEKAIKEYSLIVDFVQLVL
ncbi:Wax synthase domain containing protein [Parasponia andersonii]|uniref:Wax synthase domain containing protein n=1 Tax=Parasponia andersonii TaxID=3476 RepID=A0A2P5AQ85_PARAD|nr:Wax synthase domain containing protein [Parasponia andersonii]